MITQPTLPPSAGTAWLHHGQSLEAHGRFAEAVAAYEHALVASRADARAHGIAWMNRGNALQKIGTDSLAAAIDSYDRAIALFRTLPCETEPACRNHLGAAWLNRGHALIASGDALAAAESLEHAIAHFEKLPIDAAPYYRLNLAGARTNLAHVLLASDAARAHTLAQAALTLLAGVERAHPAFAEMSLRARRALVMTSNGEHDRALIVGSTDAIDEGLSLAREWESRGVAELRPLAARLFRLGAQLYRTHQPHFLAEFILDNLARGAFAADAEFLSAADEALTVALAELQKPQLLVLGDVASARLLETARALRAAQQQLSASIESLSSNG